MYCSIIGQFIYLGEISVLGTLNEKASTFITMVKCSDGFISRSLKKIIFVRLRFFCILALYLYNSNICHLDTELEKIHNNSPFGVSVA